MGIGHKIDEEELVEIATDKEHVFVIDDFNHLIDKLNAVLKLSCEASKIIFYDGVANQAIFTSERSEIKHLINRVQKDCAPQPFVVGSED